MYFYNPFRSVLVRFCMSMIGLLLAAYLLMLLLASHANAATITLQPIYDWANQFFHAILEGISLAVSGWVMFVFHKYLTPWIGAQLESKARDSLNTALANGVAIAMSKVQGAEALHTNVEVKNQITAWAAQYAIDHAGDAVTKFGYGPNELAMKALAYIPPAPTAQDTTGAMVPKPTAIEEAPLPDLTPGK